jgi:hypothetical protein
MKSTSMHSLYLINSVQVLAIQPLRIKAFYLTLIYVIAAAGIWNRWFHRLPVFEINAQVKSPRQKSLKSNTCL